MSKNTKVICILPTRGLIYAKTISGVLNNIIPENLVIVDELPMPDCFNHGVEVALEMGATHVWIVEEDNEIPDAVLEAMLAEDKPIVTMDYPVAGGVSHIHENNGDKWCGIGCTLIKREVFESLKKPWFRVDKVRDHKTGKWSDLPSHQIKKKFGGHDVWFFIQAAQKGYDINVLPGFKGQHFRAEELPKREMNHGMYTINSL